MCSTTHDVFTDTAQHRYMNSDVQPSSNCQTLVLKSNSNSISIHSAFESLNISKNINFICGYFIQNLVYSFYHFGPTIQNEFKNTSTYLINVAVYLSKQTAEF